MSHPAFILSAFTTACTFTTANYTPLNPSPRLLVARAPEQVELFSSGPPTRPHVDVGLITVEEGEIGHGTPDALLQLLRRAAGEKGCDALVVAPPGSKSESLLLSDRTQSYRVYSGTCIVYSAPAAAVAPTAPVAPVATAVVATPAVPTARVQAN